MPMKLSVAHSRKVGEPNYGSRGASVHLEVEVDASLVRQPQEMRDKIKYLFYLARTGVEQELAEHPIQPQRTQSKRNGAAASSAAANGHG